MTRHWLLVFIAGVLEVGWVSGLKYAQNTLEWIATGIIITLSFIILILATKHLPVGTVYAVFAGLGTAGTVIVEMAVFGEPFKLMKVLLIIMLLAGVVGLKLLSDRAPVEKGGSQ
ncbi:MULTISPECIES: DMT family transporter [Cytobacillus]|uniref:DMT family transporter n=1 Tax=Cytobacillus TaxID=2675230 RepID=UPI001CD53033|nr:multidrug efflux SMR transporter [Cytobacillus kochii]MCA1025112.1 multidrug efflux SMR transporter [Cytobacillus kochii]MCM3324155.1 multidrug efflux SMR transporter [Cytobacillus kochii]MCM3346442.1 multidrug efflux SMR transporter [Cytobacillus kochii]MDM5206750.1 multidrug efflux SMR transporter [Cytobacillus kochii]